MIAGQSISVLAITMTSGGTVVLGIAPTMSLEALARILRERGVAVERPARPPT